SDALCADMGAPPGLKEKVLSNLGAKSTLSQSNHAQRSARRAVAKAQSSGGMLAGGAIAAVVAVGVIYLATAKPAPMPAKKPAPVAATLPPAPVVSPAPPVVPP